MSEARSMETEIKDPAWDSLTHEQKNAVLYERQKALLDEFLEHGAISKAQHDKSLHDLTEKMEIFDVVGDNGGAAGFCCANGLKDVFKVSAINPK